MSHAWQGGESELYWAAPLRLSELMLLGRRYADWVLAEQVGRLNRELFGPRLVNGEWEKGTHSCGDCGTVLATRVAGGRTAGTVGADGQVTPPWRRTAQLTGLTSCGSANLCPRCARKVRAQRAEEVGTVLRRHLGAGGGAVLLTHTFSHERVEAIEVVMTDAMDCWRGWYESEAGKRLRGESTGYFRNTEVTFGERAGVHPHHHVVWLFDAPLVEVEIEALRRDALAAWSRQANKRGRRVDSVHGVDAVAIRDETGIGEYVSGIAMEMTRSDLKVGGRFRVNRSSWEVAADAADTDNPHRLADRLLWRELATAMARHRFIATSQGLWRAFGLRGETDEEIAAKVLPMETTVFFEPQVFRAAIRAGAVAAVRLSIEKGQTPGQVLAMLQKRLLMPLELTDPGVDDRGVPTIRLEVDPDPSANPSQAWREMRSRIRAEAVHSRRPLAADCAALAEPCGVPVAEPGPDLGLQEPPVAGVGYRGGALP